MEFLQKNKKAIGFTLGALSAAGVVMYLMGSEDKSQTSLKQTHNQQVEMQAETEVKIQWQNQQPQNLQSSTPLSQQEQQTAPLSQQEQKLEDIKKRIQVKFINNKKDFKRLEMITISQILENSIELAEAEYVQVTIQNRRERRAIINKDQELYERLILNYNEEIENVLIRAQEEILEVLELEKEEFEESVLLLMEKGLYQQIYMLQAAIRQKIKEKIKSTKNVSMDQTKQIIKYQVTVLNNKPEIFQKIISKLAKNAESAQMIPMVLNTMLQDFIYEEFQIEEEDQMRNMMGPDILSDPEIAESLMEIEQAMFKIMGDDMNMQGGMPPMQDMPY